MSERLRAIVPSLIFALVACRTPARSETPTEGAHPSAETLVVLNKSAATASLVDPTTAATFGTIATGVGPHEIAVAPDGHHAVVSNYGSPEAPGNSLSVLDIAARRMLKTISLDRHRRPHGVAWLSDGRRLVVTSEASQALLVVDGTTGHIDATIPIGQDTSHMVVVSRFPTGAPPPYPDQQQRAYVANIGSGSVTMIDLVAQRVLRTTVTGAGAEGIDISPGGEQVWVTNREANTIGILDAETLDLVATIPTTPFPIRVKFTPDGRRALVTHARASELRVYDAVTRESVGKVHFRLDPKKAVPTMLGPSFGDSAIPIGLLVAPNGTTAYVATAGTDEVAEVDIAEGKVRRWIRAGREPDGLGWVR